jgi:hypothetical protein
MHVSGSCYSKGAKFRIATNTFERTPTSSAHQIRRPGDEDKLDSATAKTVRNRADVLSVIEAERWDSYIDHFKEVDSILVKRTAFYSSEMIEFIKLVSATRDIDYPSE